MIDFTSCPVNRFRAYGGANGNKINITYQGHSYMLKFPPKPSRNRDMSYSNGCISEYVACHIFEMLGFRTQETLLGNYTDNRGKTKLVVACRDFTEDGKRLIEFAHLKTPASAVNRTVMEKNCPPFWRPSRSRVFIQPVSCGNFLGYVYCGCVPWKLRPAQRKLGFPRG